MRYSVCMRYSVYDHIVRSYYFICNMRVHKLSRRYELEKQFFKLLLSSFYKIIIVKKTNYFQNNNYSLCRLLRNLLFVNIY